MVFDIFSKRQRLARGEVPDVYSYDRMPDQLKGQIIHVAIRCLGDGNHYQSEEAYRTIVNILREERGVFSLITNGSNRSRDTEFFNYFKNEPETELALDCVELICKAIEANLGEPSLHSAREFGIDNINTRFREHGVGYQYENNQLIRIDSQIIHAEAVKPALSLLTSPSFSGANEEFMHAHAHYRQGNNKACLVDCLKSLESVLKIILNRRNVKYGAGDTASKLLQAAFDNNIIAPYLQNQFSALRTTLESGVPTIRNKLGGHGQGEELKPVPDFMASYALHLTASAILFLAQADEHTG